MAKFLTKAEYIEDAPTQVGAQVHINHKNCPAGTDRKRRLYVKRLDSFTVVAFCHHCGKRGTNKKFSRASLEPFEQVESKPLWKIPDDFVRIDEAPSGAQHWVYAYLAPHVAHKYSIGYSEKLRRVVLPIWKDGHLACYQARRVHADDLKPKYLTFKNDKAPFFFVHKHPDVVVLVEDMLSAIVLSEYGYATIAMLGTYISNNVINYILDKYTQVIVMLDDNNIEVKKQALRIQNQLNLFLPPVLVAKTDGRDPKSMTKQEIEQCILRSTL